MIRTTIMALAALMVSPVQSAPLRFDDVAPIVYADIKMAFAGMRANTYMPNTSLIETIGEFIGIPGDETPVLFGPYAMIDGCRRHSCIEKAAIIVDMRSRTTAAVALRNYDCRHVVLDDSDIAAIERSANKHPTVRCNDEPILDIYIVRRSIKPEALRDERKQLAQLRKWGSIVGHQEERIQVLVRQKSR